MGPPNDDERPLDPVGERQAQALVDCFQLDRPERLLSSPTRRCVDTLRPLASELDLPIESCDALRADAGTAELLHAFDSHTFDRSVLCTHGEAMTPVIDVLDDLRVHITPTSRRDDLLLKGAVWQLSEDSDSWLLELQAPIPTADCPQDRRRERVPG